MFGYRLILVCNVVNFLSLYVTIIDHINLTIDTAYPVQFLKSIIAYLPVSFFNGNNNDINNIVLRFI